MKLAACFLVALVLSVSQYSWAGTSSDIELAKAAKIAELKGKLDKAVADVSAAAKAAAPAAAVKSLQEVVERAKADLDEAVQAVYRGTTEEGVRKAEQMMEKSRTVDELKKTIEQNPGLAAPLQKALDIAQSDLKQKVSDVSEAESLKQIADQRFAGFNFGVAIAGVFKAGKRDLIQAASLDANGIVRVDRDDNSRLNLILESHYFFTPKSSFFGVVDSRDWGHGPFIAVQPGTENIIQSVGAGWMIGFKRSNIVGKDLARDRGDSFNIGFGVMANPNARVLGDGIQKNQPLPTGETSVRLRTTTEIGYLITFSYSF